MPARWSPPAGAARPATIGSKAAAMPAALLLCLLPAAGPMAAAADAPAPAPTLHVEMLDRSAPGWNPVESKNEGNTGSLVIERLVWPLFYLHWRPLAGPDGVGDKLSVAEAEKVVSSLWDGLIFDTPPQGRKIDLPAHEGVLVETTTSHGGWKTRYLLWACPESGRLFIADMNASLQVSAPPGLMDLMDQIARTVRCHKDAKVGAIPGISKKRDVPDTDVSYSLPYTWFPVEGYRVQKVFGEGDFAGNTHPAPTSAEGQDLALELDALRRLYVTWEPAPDEAMTFDMLTRQVHEFWKKHASDLLPQGTRVSNDVWIMEGMARTGEWATPYQSGMHRFRAWVWRKEGRSYLAVGELGGVKFGQRVMTQIQDIANLMLEEMYQAIDY